MTRYLIRATLRREAPVAALAPLLLPQAPDARTEAAHRLVWSLMPGDAAATRDFLWRESAPGQFLLLAARPPTFSALLDIDYREFDPNLSEGDRLHFVLRANPTAAVRQDNQRGKRADVVMRALHSIPSREGVERAVLRPELIKREGTAWLVRQARGAGFALDVDKLVVDGYEQRRIPRPNARPLRYSSIDYTGLLTVTDPIAFIDRVISGFGRARAFGCGLMLIRRARDA